MSKIPPEITVLIRSAGEVASGIAHRLYQYHFRVCLTEIARPLAVSRGTAYSEAIFQGSQTIQGITAELIAPSLPEIERVWRANNIPLVIDPAAAIRETLKPDVVIDAIMAKEPTTGTKITDAPLVIGIGPGFYAGKDVHIVIESNEGPNLAKIIRDGEAEKNTGAPIAVGGLTYDRVVWAPQAGTFQGDFEIGDTVRKDQVIARIDDIPLKAPISGKLRGIIRSGFKVPKGAKLIEVDQINDSRTFYLIRDKIFAIGGGVAEAIMQTYGTK